MSIQAIQFVRRGKVVRMEGVDPNTTLLELLRERMACTGTKEGCGEGDCGACTVVIGELEKGKIVYKAINSCIRTAHSVNGMALWTVEDLNQDPLLTAQTVPTRANESIGEAINHFESDPAPAHARLSKVIRLHPVQQAMVDQHASQCGFCTPGFVMSLFALYQSTAPKGLAVDRAKAQEVLSGNLCRCTGYRPIFEAAQTMGHYPAVRVNEAALKKLLVDPSKPNNAAATPPYLQPTSLLELCTARAKFPGAQVVAGCTDVGLWITKLHKQFSTILDTTATRELQAIEDYPNHVAIGAAASLTKAFTVLAKTRPQLKSFFNRFAGLPVRNSGTLGGNIANGSPIGDSMPLLIALRANVVLSRLYRGKVVHRELRLEDLYTGYRSNVMQPDELLTWIKVPKPHTLATGKAKEFARVYKISKRFDDDISAVCLGLSMVVHDGRVAHISIGAGGVAAMPRRATLTEGKLLGQPWTEAMAQQAGQWLNEEFQPISDMRASGRYRKRVLEHLMQRFWLESQGVTSANLESLNLEALA
jgi:xanthine dehydrogenase small subunit